MTAHATSRAAAADTMLRSVVVATPWFPNHRDDWYARYIYESTAAIQRLGIPASVLVCRPYLPKMLARLAPTGTTGKIDTASFAREIHSIRTVRYPALPRGILRSITNLSSSRIIVPALVTLARQAGASLIHAQTEGMAPMAVTAGATLNIPVVATVHGLNMNARYLHAKAQRRLLAPALARVDRLLLVGESLRSFFSSYAGRSDHIRVLGNGVHLPSKKRTRVILESGPLRIVSVANLQEGKGLEVALEALSLLDASGARDWTYEVVGEGPMLAALREMTVRLGLASRVAFLGARPQAFVFDRLLDSDVFVLPSFREAFGIAYLEAMASGLPSIGISGQGPEAFIESGRTGILVAPHDARAVADSLIHLIRYPEQAREMGARAALAARDFTWDAHAARLVEIYREVLAERAT